MCLVRSGADYSFKEPKEPLSAPVLSPADTRSCIVILLLLCPPRDLGSRQPYPPLLLGQLDVARRVSQFQFPSPSFFPRSIDRFKKEAVAIRYDDGSVEIVEGVPLSPPHSSSCVRVLYSLNCIYRRLRGARVRDFRDRARDTAFRIGRKLRAAALKASSSPPPFPSPPLS